VGLSGGLAGLIAALLLLPLTVWGCSTKGAPATLSGQVKFRGEPVAKGSIRLDPVEGQGQPASAPITDGRYEIGAGAGLVAGKYRVSITGVRVVGTREDPETGQTIEETEQYIPENYNTRTTLEIAITAGENKKDFDLQ
jgi:hypothetical protein